VLRSCSCLSVSPQSKFISFVSPGRKKSLSDTNNPIVLNLSTNSSTTPNFHPSQPPVRHSKESSNTEMVSPPGPSEGPGPSKMTVVGKAFPHIDLDGHNLPPSPAPSSPRNGRKYALATELVYTESKDQYGSSSMPIYQSATFKQTSANGGNEYDYTRSGNPTRTHLERHLAKIMNASRALVVGSGMGALDVITRILRPGDEVITGDDLYGGTNRLLTFLLLTELLSIMLIQQIQSALET